MPSSECHTLHLPSCRNLTIMSYNIGEGAADSRTELAAFIRCVVVVVVVAVSARPRCR